MIPKAISVTFFTSLFCFFVRFALEYFLTLEEFRFLFLTGIGGFRNGFFAACAVSIAFFANEISVDIHSDFQILVVLPPPSKLRHFVEGGVKLLD